jgi:hypothetical protein
MKRTLRIILKSVLVSLICVVPRRRELIVKEHRCSGTARRISVLFQNLKDGRKEPAQFKYSDAIKHVQQHIRKKPLSGFGRT